MKHCLHFNNLFPVKWEHFFSRNTEAAKSHSSSMNQKCLTNFISLKQAPCPLKKPQLVKISLVAKLPPISLMRKPFDELSRTQKNEGLTIWRANSNRSGYYIDCETVRHRKISNLIPNKTLHKAKDDQRRHSETKDRIFWPKDAEYKRRSFSL